VRARYILLRFCDASSCRLRACFFVTQAHAGLVAYYAFDETSGTTAADSSGNGNTGTLTNMTGSEWTTGKVGGALDFDGTNDYVNLGSVASSAPLALAGSAFTISAWVKTTSRVAVSQRILDKSTAGSVVADTWNHVAVTGDVSNYQFYVDGIARSGTFVSGSYHSPPSVTANTAVGSWLQNNARMFQGSIDELRIYSSALSAGEVAALAGSAPEPAETFAFLGLLTAGGLGFREWRDRKAKTA
jgi:hypothetical protein